MKKIHLLSVITLLASVIVIVISKLKSIDDTLEYICEDIIDHEKKLHQHDVDIDIIREK